MSIDVSKQDRFTGLCYGVQAWALNRNFFADGGATYKGQWMKLVEEFGELALGLNKRKPDVIKDSIGDVIVVLCVLDGFGGRCLMQEYKLEPTDQHTETVPSFCVFRLLQCIEDLYKAKHMNDSLFAEVLQCAMHWLCCLAKINGLDVVDCLEYSYNEIKDRKGKMVNGVFIKEEDL